MKSITFRNLKYEESERIKEINASQYIENAWREVDGKRQLIEIDYHDPDWPNGYENHLNKFKETLKRGGSAIGAFDADGKLVGFATINREFFGVDYKYVLLDQLFITLEKRNNGIGKKLFMLAAKTAKEWGAEKLYICAGSAEDTIAFYRKMGCVDTIELQQDLYESDPRDLQLEFSLDRV